MMVLGIFDQPSIGFDPSLHYRFPPLMVHILPLILTTLRLFQLFLCKVHSNILVIIRASRLGLTLFLSPTMLLPQGLNQLSALRSRQPLVSDPQSTISPLQTLRQLELMIEIDAMIPLIPCQAIRSLDFLRAIYAPSFVEVLSLSYAISCLIEIQPQLTDVRQQTLDIPTATFVCIIDLSFYLNDLILLPLVTLTQ